MIDISQIQFKYKGQHNTLYNDFSLQLKPGSIYGLLGMNATGKSTLLYLIAGLLRPQAGTVTVDGMNTAERHVQILRDMFIVPEEFSLPDTSLQNYIRVNSVFYPHFSHEVLNECLTDFGLDTRVHLQALSMGQKKKVYMSFALAAGTRVLLMDEPTNGLDIPSKSQFRKVVARYMDEQRTIVISTHQVHDVETLLDHIVIMNRGQVALNAPVADVCSRYTFTTCQPGQTMPHALYTEHALQGDRVMGLRQEGDEETSLDLELLFNAIVSGSLQSGTRAEERKEAHHAC